MQFSSLACHRTLQEYNRIITNICPLCKSLGTGNTAYWSQTSAKCSWSTIIAVIQGEHYILMKKIRFSFIVFNHRMSTIQDYIRFRCLPWRNTRGTQKEPAFQFLFQDKSRKVYKHKHSLEIGNFLSYPTRHCAKCGGVKVSPVLLFLTRKKKGWSTITWGYSTAILLMAIIPEG